MRTFAELLTEYMERTGIGDAELARRIQVSRPTLLRWKEGVTTRPRYREDVLRCAEILRLTPEETDELLLAAGYSPEHQTVPQEPDEPGQPNDDQEPEESQEPPEIAGDLLPIPARPGGLVVPAGRGGALSVSRMPTLEGLGVRRRRISRSGVGIFLALIGLAAVIAIGAIANVLGDDGNHPTAAQGENLIVVAPFANYTGGGQGFNVAGRLQEAIDGEMLEAGLQRVRSARWPEVIENGEAARQASERSGASLVVWGEYDSGRVISRFTAPADRPDDLDQHLVDIPSSPAELTSSINISLVEEVRYIALLTLGQIYLEQKEHDQAKTILVRALAGVPPGDKSLTNIRFLLAQAYLGGRLADLDEAIRLFDQVLAVQPTSVEALNGRGLAYLRRGRNGDTTRAIADLTNARSIEPQRPATELNLAVAYVQRRGAGDINRALGSMGRALEYDPEYAQVFVNRASLYIGRGEPGDLEEAFLDLEEALEIQPSLSAAYIVRAGAYLARGYRGDREEAIAELSRAIGLEPASDAAYFSRGLIYSELGDWHGSLTDFRRSQQLNPQNAVYNSTLCLQESLTGSPEAGLQYCDWALALEPEGLALDSRALAHSLAGNTAQAVSDYEAFLEWLRRSTRESCRQYYEASRMNWLETLRQGGDPFSAHTLQQLRPRPALPGKAPC